MNLLRRGALVRAGKLLAGGAASMAMLGNAGRGRASETATGLSLGYASDAVLKTQTGFVDPMWEARHKASLPLREKMRELEMRSHFALTDNMNTDNSSYLPALKSTAPWWRAHVMQEHRKRRYTAMQTLQDQINKIMDSPMNKLEEIANEALGAFMAEIQKP